MPDLPNIRTAHWDDVTTVSAILTVAMAPDPFVRWILPDPYAFASANNVYPGLSSAAAFDSGSAFITDDNGGFALWLPPGSKDKTDKAALKEFVHQYFDPHVLPTFFELSDKCDAYRPKDPHWYLNIVAVDPAKSGRGYGTALIEHSLKRVDEDGLPAYLESTNVKNLTIYQRFGFELLAEVQVGNSPIRYPMLRPAR